MTTPWVVNAHALNRKWIQRELREVGFGGIAENASSISDWTSSKENHEASKSVVDLPPCLLA